MAPMAASGDWNMEEWDQMAEYVSRLDDGDETQVHGLGNAYVERAQKCMPTELAALVLESYERAYSKMVCVCQTLLAIIALVLPPTEDIDN
ncbi:hypothetical protein UlMin_036847 [Ulmus minor]